MIFRASIANMSISGNVGSVGNTLRIEVTSNVMTLWLYLLMIIRS